MGNEVNVEFIKAKQTFADFKAGNKDGELKADEKEAIEIFQTAVVDAYGNGQINDETFNEAMGLYKSAPAATTEADVNPEEVAKEEKVETKADKKAKKTEAKIKEEDQNAIKKDIEDLVKNALNGKDAVPVDLSTVVDRLKADNSNPVYADAIKKVEEVVTAIQAKKYNSKNEIEALEKNIKKAYNLSEFQKDILPELVKLAKEDQINKETKVLEEIYNEVKSDKKVAKNYTGYLNSVKEIMEKRYLKDNSYFSDEAFEKLENIVKAEIVANTQKEMEAMEVQGENDTDRDDIIETVINGLPDGDKTAKKVVEEMKGTATTTANRLNRERTRENLKSISDEDLRKELDDKTYRLLRANLLGNDLFKNDDGTYNLSTLSDAIRSVIGADEEMNSYGDYKRSEIQAAIDELKDMIDRGDLKEAQMNDLKELCNIKDAQKSRKAEDIFGNARDEAIGGAVIGAALSAARIENVATATVNGIAQSTSRQVITISPLIAIPGVAAAEIAVDALVKAIIGVKKPEATCFNYEYAEGKTLDQYLEKLKDTADSKEQYNAIAILVKLYENKYGEGWNTEFVNDMKNAAGADSALNCREFNSAYNGLIEKLKKAEGATCVDCNATVEQEHKETPNEEIPWHTHTTEAGQEWQYIIEARYPELTKKYGLWGKNGAIKRVQRAMYTDKNGNFDEEGFKELIGFRNLRPIMYLPLEVDGFAINTENTIKTSKQTEGKGNPVKGTAPNGVHVKLGQTENGDFIVTSTCDPTKTGKASTIEEAFKLLEEATPNVNYTNKDELIKKHTQNK